MKKSVLTGNPNSGKTTLYNNMTGSRERTGNRCGVTVDIIGRKIKGKDLILYDLPGVYSLNAYSNEEEKAIEYLKRGDYSFIVNIVDGRNLKRNLYLTVELLMLNKPVIIALNMIDEVEKKNIFIDVKKLSGLLGVKIVKTNGLNGTGINELISSLEDIKANNNIKNIYTKFRSEEGSKDKAIYKTVDYILSKCVRENHKGKSVSEKADKIILNKYTAFPIFLAVTGLIFAISFGKIGTFIKTVFFNLFSVFIASPLKNFLQRNMGSPDLYEFITEGVLGGFELIISFLPQIIVLFICISVIEDTGYMARIAFIMDKALCKIGLSGKSIIPLIMGFSCTTSSVMTSRIIENDRERKLAILLTPYMSCSAKLPVYILFGETFFKEKTPYFILFLYLVGIIASIIIGMMLKGDNSKFIMEIPEYKIPSLKNIIRLIEVKITDFLKKTGGVIFLSGVIVWFLKNYTFTLNKAKDIKESMLVCISNYIAPLFKPLGFGSWEATASLFAGIVSKESIVSTFGIIFGCNGDKDILLKYLQTVFDKSSALSYCVFVLLFIPCIPAVISMLKEFDDKKWILKSLLLHITISYSLSMLLYFLANL